MEEVTDVPERSKPRKISLPFAELSVLLIVFALIKHYIYYTHLKFQLSILLHYQN